MNNTSLLLLLCFLLSTVTSAHPTATPKPSTSAKSDIIRDNTFDEPDNIDYQLHTLNSIKVGAFLLRDGGAGGDSDGEDTVLETLEMNISGASNLKYLDVKFPIGLGSGTSTQSVTINGNTATITFAAFFPTALDEKTRPLELLATFDENTVTDNQQLQITVTSASVVSTINSSTFATPDAGGAATSIIGDNNRIEVTSDRLQFGQGPSDVQVLTAMSPAVTVEAVDGNGRLDLDATPVITMAANGSSFSTGAAQTAISAIDGIATFSQLIFDAATTGVTLSATGGALTGTSNSPPFDVTTSAPLPIILTGFQARVAHNQVVLQWATETELRNDYMALERSEDGRSFREIARLPGQGTTQHPQAYRYHDRGPLPGLNYYRLRQVDFDDQTTFYGPVKALLPEARPQLQAWPTVARSVVTVRYPAPLPAGATLQLYNEAGQLLREQHYPASTAGQLILPLSGLPDGPYILNLKGADQPAATKIVKQR